MKLSSNNKINKQNAWHLGLIDVMETAAQPIGDDDEDDYDGFDGDGENAAPSFLPSASAGGRGGHKQSDLPNFQRAAGVLEAAVKIYSSRVDDAHNLVYRFRGGLSGASRDVIDDNDNDDDDDDSGSAAAAAVKAKKDAALRRGGKTLELRAGALNFPVDMNLRLDPLFEKTSAAMDQRKAASLLLNTLTVARGCRVMFDSFDNTNATSATGDSAASAAADNASASATAAASAPSSVLASVSTEAEAAATEADAATAAAAAAASALAAASAAAAFARASSAQQLQLDLDLSRPFALVQQVRHLRNNIREF